MPQEREAPEQQFDVQPAVAQPLPTGMPAMPAGVSNAAVARAAASAAAQGLPSNAHAALRALGPQAAAVRLHTGPAADAALAARPGALAMTQGADIHIGSAAPALDSPGGQMLLAHEAVHVRQQTAAGPAVSREAAEQEADSAAVAVLAGAPVPDVSAAEGPLYFEAHWHQASLTGAMHQLGFTDQEGEDAYFGNWCRDLSQFLVPMASSTIGPQAAFSMVNLLAMHHFGHGVTPAELGVYDPHQHIDNPAGTTDRDVLPSGVTIEGYGDQSHAAGPEDPSSLDPAHIRDQFAVSAAGVPAYMEASRQLVEREALTAIELGRTREAMLHVGNFSHTMEDLFAHSNWVEIAVGRVVSEHVDLIPAGETRDEVQTRIDEHRPPIENYAADVQGVGGEARPILSTGTFSGGGAGNDTLISIKAEAQNLLKDREPFKEDGGGGEMYDFAIEVLKHAQESADEGVLGPMFTAVVEQAITNLGSLALGELDALPGRARSALGDNVFGDIAAGAAELLSEGADAASQWAGDAWKSGLRDQLGSIVNGLGGAIGFAEMLVYLKGEANAIADAWKGLKDWVRELPDMLKEAILPQLVAAEREFKKQVRALLNAAYGRAVEVLIDQLEGIHPIVDAAETNVGVKEQHMREKLERELKPQMIAILTEVGGEEGARLAGRIQAMTAEDVAAFASSDAFHQILQGLAADVGARARLQSAADSMSDTQHTVNQLGNVPDWAKAGASHSQTAKDHDDTAFFGIAFACAQRADHMVLSDLQAAWMERGFIGPGAGMEGNFDATPTGNEAEDARRAAFLKTRGDGDYAVQHGHAENQDIGPRLAELAGSVEAIIHAHPILDPVLGGLAAVMRGNPTADAVRAELEATRARWEQTARSGELDDDVMATVDRAIGTVARLLGTVGTDEHGDEHDFDSHHPAQHHDDPDTPGDEGHDHGGRSEVAFRDQLDRLDAHRGANAVESDPGVGSDRGDPASEPIVETIRTLFNHPYENNWWYELVLNWCREHPEVLERSIRDKNAGVMHSHAH